MKGRNMPPLRLLYPAAIQSYIRFFVFALNNMFETILGLVTFEVLTSRAEELDRSLLKNFPQSSFRRAMQSNSNVQELQPSHAEVRTLVGRLEIRFVSIQLRLSLQAAGSK